MRPYQLGVPPLDRRLGPLPDHVALLIENEPGTDPLPIVHQSVATLVNEGSRVVYCAIDRPAATVDRQLMAAGMVPEAAKEHLVLVDGYSRGSGAGATSSAWPVSLQPNDMADAASVLHDIARREASSTLVIDSLSAFADEAPSPGEFLQQLPELLGAIRRFRASQSLFTLWPYAATLKPMHRGFDAVISLHGLHSRTLFGEYFTIDQIDWRPNSAKKPVAYRVRQPHGVIEYIPKILVTGPHHAGKTTFVQNVSDAAKSVNRLGTTVVLDHGQISLDDFTADVFGTAGQRRFDALLTMLAGSAMGIVLVVDATNPRTLKRARTMAKATRSEGIPLIVAANKQDLEHALDAREIALLLDLPWDVPVMPCTAKDPASCRAILQQLVRRIRAPEVAA